MKSIQHLRSQSRPWSDNNYNLHEPESKKLEALHKKVGGVRRYLRVTVGKTSRYFDAEFAPVSDDTIFIEGTVAEKSELANLLRTLVTETPRGDQ